ncbi:MAG: hypothetical protein FWC32_05025 [Firmicutes bacterium]|nr:hypothetical protein [Bacillota bacterium]
MSKRYAFDRLFEGNKLVLMCVLFTVSIISAAISSTITGVQIYLSLRFVIVNLVFLSAPVIPLAAAQHLLNKKRISENSYYFWVGIPIHYFVSCGLLTFYLSLFHLFQPGTIRAYVNTVINFSVGYAAIGLGAAAIDLIQTASANKHLRKIRENHEGEIKWKT